MKRSDVKTDGTVYAVSPYLEGRDPGDHWGWVRAVVEDTAFVMRAHRYKRDGITIKVLPEGGKAGYEMAVRPQTIICTWDEHLAALAVRKAQRAEIAKRRSREQAQRNRDRAEVIEILDACGVDRSGLYALTDDDLVGPAGKEGPRLDWADLALLIRAVHEAV